MQIPHPHVGVTIYFKPMSHFYIPWKRQPPTQKKKRFLGGIEMGHLRENA